MKAVLRRVRPAVGAALALFLAACSTATIDDAVPGAHHTGQFPNLNIPQLAATTQMTDEETAAATGQLVSARAATKDSSTPPASEADRLRKLGDTHAKTALQEIEK